MVGSPEAEESGSEFRRRQVKRSYSAEIQLSLVNRLYFPEPLHNSVPARSTGTWVDLAKRDRIDKPHAPGLQCEGYPPKCSASKDRACCLRPGSALITGGVRS